MATEIAHLKELTLEMFISRDKALSVAVETLQARLDTMNEFRGALADQANGMIMRTEYDTQHAALVREVDLMRTSLARLATQYELTDKSSAIERAALETRYAASVTAEDRTDSRIKSLETKSATWDGRLWAVGVVLTIANLAVNWYLFHPVH